MKPVSAPVPLRNHALALVVLTYGCSPNADAQRTGLSWVPCGGEFECSELLVPRDYGTTGGPTWKIPVIRAKATNASKRIGSLVFNPGGPGISGVEYLRSEGIGLTKLRERYDLVSFDPRGAGASVPALNCLSPEDVTEIRNQVSAPEASADVDRAVALATSMAAKCQAQYGDWLPFVGTRDVARDMDRLRNELGDDKLTYLGFSYGTYLGATYAGMFPGRTARMVLDGAMDPSLDYDGLRRDQALAMDAALRRFVTACQAGPDCPLAGDADQGLRSLDGIVKALDIAPYVASDGRTLSGSRALGLIQSATYFPPDTWAGLRGVLAQALRSEYGPMLELAFSPALMVNPADTPYLSVMCHDLGTSRGSDGMATLADEWRSLAPLNGPSRAWSTLPCRLWPARSATPPAAIRAEGSGPIVVLGTLHDPATPVGWAKSLSSQLAQGTYVEWSGDGHLAYGRGGSCVDTLVEAFLLEGKVPNPGTTCP